MIHARFFPLSPKHFAAWVFAFVASLLLAGIAKAQTERTPPYYGDDNIAVALLAAGLPKAGEEWMLALRFEPSAPEWHG